MAHVLDVSIAEPGELNDATLEIAEALVRSAFGDDFRTHDWLHGVPGVHVLVTENGELLAHAAVVARELRQGNRVFDTGYLEGVAVRGDQQGRGLGRLVMDHAESIIRTRHQIGALNAVDDAASFYAARGWHPWSGPTGGQSPAGIIDTYDAADRIFVLMPGSHPPLRATEPLICDWRIGDLW
ncbi:GNAT family N-acetyltransferase [Mycolicibacterium litorale]|uniref:GNAT family N-acetyltransferase n=1 Tax=Mycolicibacterium litorale TaxID=758802 RepID=UPI0013D4024D|nr:GNAT family N-acetyltransferase [Mycolicibacterium litorale]MCV7417482.1 GNAT family N-acetyltransferase [Mycolicibacterium litorale]